MTLKISQKPLQKLLVIPKEPANFVASRTEQIPVLIRDVTVIHVQPANLSGLDIFLLANHAKVILRRGHSVYFVQRESVGPENVRGVVVRHEVE